MRHFQGNSLLVAGGGADVPHCMQAVGFAELKQQAREECVEQRRDHYVPFPDDTAPCYLNEKTCHEYHAFSGMGNNINLTYDWKHYIYEDYDRWLYNKCAAALHWDLRRIVEGARCCLWLLCLQPCATVMASPNPAGGVKRAAQTTSS